MMLINGKGKFSVKSGTPKVRRHQDGFKITIILGISTRLGGFFQLIVSPNSTKIIVLLGLL